MATPLTWRNVAAPDFTGSLEGLRTSSLLLDRSLGQIGNAVSAFDRAQTEGSNQRALLNALQYQDPESYRQALMSGTIVSGLDPARLSTDTIASLGNRATSLLDQAAKQQSVDQTAYANNRVQTQNANLDAAGPAVAELVAATQSRDPNAVSAVWAKNQDILSRLTPEQITSLGSTGQRLEGGATANADSRFGLDVRQRDDANTQAANNAVAEIQRLGLSNQDQVAGALDSLNLPAASRLIAARALGLPTGPTGAGGSGAVGGNPYDTVVGNGKFGTPTQPLSSMSVGDVLNFGSNTLIPNSKAAGVGQDSRGLVGSSAAGAFQITGETLKQYGPKVFGDNWQNVPFSAENQDKLAEAIFNDRKGGNLKDTWKSLPNTEKGAYKDVPWSQMRNVIAQGEVGQQLQPVTQVRQTAFDAAAGAAQRNIQNRSSGLGNSLITASQGEAANASPAQAANSLIERAFKGSDSAVLEDRINQIVAQSGGRLNPSQAAAIIERSTERSDSPGIQNLPGRGWRALFGDVSDLGGGRRINDRQLQANIDEAINGGAVREASVNNENQLNAQTRQVAQQQYDAAYNDLVTLQTRARDRPILAAQIPAAQARLLAAQQALNAVSVGTSAQTQFNPRPGPQQQAAQAAAAIEAAAQRGRDARQGQTQVSPNDGPPALDPRWASPPVTRAVPSGIVVTPGNPAPWDYLISNAVR